MNSQRKKIRLKRIGLGEYEYKEWVILRDDPQPDLSVGGLVNQSMWNLYRKDDQSEVEIQRPYLKDIRLHLEFLENRKTAKSIK